MNANERFLTFEPNVHTALWGEEKWEISVHPSSPSVIAGGPLAGSTLPAAAGDFNLLVKVIDARTRLSVQVHPNETTKLTTGGDAKTEMWCALTAGPIYAGLKEGTSAADVEKAVADGSFENLLVKHDARPGDCFFIPGGLVHAIGDGIALYEVQQSSDTTFRLYDWGRTGADGKPRQLHVKQALQAIDYSLGAPVASESVKSPFFDFRKIRPGRGTVLPGASWTVVYAWKGAITLDGKEFAEGTSVFVRPGGDFTMSGEGIAFVTRP